MRLICFLIAAGAALAAPAWATAAPPVPWPPATGKGVLFAHYGEEHWDDPDGLTLLPKVVGDVARYKPNLVVMAGDKANDGTVAQLTRWREIMAPYDAKGVPYFAGVGNHDRDNLSGGLPPAGSLANYIDVFRGRPYPFGDAAPITDPLFAPAARPPEDPAGASSHYWFDYANVRWILLDNSCYGFTTPGADCDSMQNPPFPDQGATDSYDFMRREAEEARRKGKLVFVQIHMPTRDPRRPHSNPTSQPHTMGEGLPVADDENARFEQEAGRAGVGAVFTGHIKGQWTYAADGVPYFIDGGAGGKLYSDSNAGTGVDTGYWHGYRLIRVTGDGRFTTDTVPIFVPGGITLTGPATLERGRVARFRATGRQPTDKGARVDALELRDPDLAAPEGPSLPAPARIWTTGNPLVLAPVAASHDDARRDPSSQTASGRFAALCPGRTPISISSGWESAEMAVTVPSATGAIVRSLRRARRRLRAGQATTLASLRLAQPGQLVARVLKRGRALETLRRTCARTGRPIAIRWDGKIGRTAAHPGAYVIEVRVTSDRPPLVRRFAVRVR